MSSLLFSSSSSSSSLSSSSSSLSMPFMSIGFVLFLLLTTKTANTSASTTITKTETLLFPGIYTLRYNNNDDTNNENENNTGSSRIKQWTTEFDFIKMECNNSNNQKEEEEEERHYNHQDCMVHLLLHSRMEYKDAISSLSSLVLSSSSSLSSPSLLLGLEYNALFTKKWITPRLQVTAEERIKKKSSNNENNTSRRRRRQQDQDQDQDQDYYYSTIETYDCYYDMKGTIQWIENFVTKYQNSSLFEVEWIDIGDSYLKSKYIESKKAEESSGSSSSSSTSVGDKLSQLQQQGQGQGETNKDTEEDDEEKGHDIMVLTITGKANSKKKKTRSSSSSTPTNSTTSTSTNRNKKRNRNYKAPFILISSTHAREYTPPELIRRWLEYLIEQIEQQDNNDYLSIFETTKLHWIPYLNPDGRVLAETIQPLRRKNLNQNWTGNTRDSNYCTSDSYGVDLNRNFPFEWGKSDGSSNKPCSSSTRGAKANSEVETNAIVNYLLSSSDDNNQNQNYNHPAVFPNLQNQLKENTISTSEGDFNINHIPNLSVEVSSTKWKGYNETTTQGIFVDIHSYGEVYIFPWGNLKNAITPNDSSYRSVMGQLQSITGLEAKQAGSNHYGVSSGCTDDWSYAITGAMSMTWELGTEFHEPCINFLQEYQKHFPAFDYLFKIAYRPYALGKGPIINEVISINNINNEGTSNTIALYYYTSMNPVSNENEVLLSSNMRTYNSTNNTANGISFQIKIELPDVLKETIPSIVFDDGTTATARTTTEQKQQRSISKIRVYYNTHPLLLGVVDDNDEGDDDYAGTTTTTTTTITSNNGTTTTTNNNNQNNVNNSNNNDYWELLFYEVEEGKNNENDKVSSSSSSLSSSNNIITYTSSINKNQVWSAFGVGGVGVVGVVGGVDSSSSTTTTITNHHMLYVQAMDSNENWGPITATSLNVMLIDEQLLMGTSTSKPTAAAAATTGTTEVETDTTTTTSATTTGTTTTNIPWGNYAIPSASAAASNNVEEETETTTTTTSLFTNSKSSTTTSNNDNSVSLSIITEKNTKTVSLVDQGQAAAAAASGSTTTSSSSSLSHSSSSSSCIYHLYYVPAIIISTIILVNFFS